MGRSFPRNLRSCILTFSVIERQRFSIHREARDRPLDWQETCHVAFLCQAFLHRDYEFLSTFFSSRSCRRYRLERWSLSWDSAQLSLPQRAGSGFPKQSSLTQHAAIDSTLEDGSPMMRPHDQPHPLPYSHISDIADVHLHPPSLDGSSLSDKRFLHSLMLHRHRPSSLCP